MKVFNANSLRGIHSTLHGQKIVVKQRVWLTFLADKFQPRTAAILRVSLGLGWFWKEAGQEGYS